ncbi:MAG: phage tail protein [Bacteroidetes bacterium]|nr:phage tail protein [Bacteroidota bacterium]
MEGTMAVVTCFGADFAPKNWASCSGQLLPIAQNQALFSLLGTTFGGNGINTFALPDLRGRTPIGTGQGAGLPNVALGQVQGTEATILNIGNMPAHVHDGAVSIRLQADNTAADSADPANETPSIFPGMYATAGANATMTAPAYSVTIGAAGGSQPVSILEPYLTLNYIICMYGLFPSRN